MSRTLEPDDPELRQKRIRPFRIHELEHIPRDQKYMHEALLRSMPEAFFSRGFTSKIGSLFEKHTGISVDFFFDAIRFHETNRLRKVIPGKTCLLVIGLAPRPEKIVVEVDLEFAYTIVAKLLGTSKSGFDVHRHLTEIEQGVFMFMALKVLAECADDWPNPEQLSLRVEDFRSDVRSAADIFKTESRWMSASWKLSYDMDIGSVRAFIPESLARATALASKNAHPEILNRTSERIWDRFQSYGDVPVDVWVETGNIELSRGDLEELEPGDIVLLEDTSIQIQDGWIYGQATMRVGLGKIAKLTGEIRMQDEKQFFEIHEITYEKPPSVHDPVVGHGAPENPEQLVAGYEDHEHGYAEQEGDDGSATTDDIFDEDYGLDDENDGDYEDYEEGEYEEGGYEEGGYEEGGYEEGGYEEGGYEEGGYEEGGYEEGGAEQAAAHQAERFPEAEPLLGDIPMVAVVELGRVQLTADEIVRLRSGQLIELGRSPTEAVDLVVNNKLVAKGELVEIEGALGVKLVSLSQNGE